MSTLVFLGPYVVRPFSLIEYNARYKELCNQVHPNRIIISKLNDQSSGSLYMLSYVHPNFDHYDYYGARPTFFSNGNDGRVHQ